MKTLDIVIIFMYIKFVKTKNKNIILDDCLGVNQVAKKILTKKKHEVLKYLHSTLAIFAERCGLWREI